jgi:hypothetical protein
MPAGGGLLQLVAQGKQDVFLSGNPQISFFKMVYRRHTNFAIESQPMYFDGTPNFGQRITCLVPRRGDLLGRVYLNITLPPIYDSSNNPVSYCNSVGHALIRELAIEVGEQEIDRQTGEWMEIWTDVTTPAGQRESLNQMIGRQKTYTPPSLYPSTNGLQLQIPLQFWFCRNPGSYLPLLALQYHPVRINITLNPLQSLFWSPDISGTTGNCTTTVQPATLANVMLWGDYVYLDTEERRRFVSNTHEYLIEQVQYTPPYTATTNQSIATVSVEFNHPIKEFFFVAQREVMQARHEYFNYSNLGLADTYAIQSPPNPPYYIGTLDTILPPPLNSSISKRIDLITSAVLQLDGYDRFQVRDAPYFRLTQMYEHHTTTPIEVTTNTGQQNLVQPLFIYNYSFSLKPEDVQPSGSMNASRIDSIVWQIYMNQVLNQSDTVNRGNVRITIYAMNYNVFRIIDGFGGLLFTV